MNWISSGGNTAAAAAAAAAKSLQSCPTLCDPIDSSPPGPTVPGILQARTLEWVAISSSNQEETLDKPKLQESWQNNWPALYKRVKVGEDRDRLGAIKGD